jgi:hypothetical protein
MFLGMGHFFPEELVQFIKVNGIFPGMTKGEVMLWMDGDVWMISLIGKERIYSSGSIGSIVVCEFCQWQ